MNATLRTRPARASTLVRTAPPKSKSRPDHPPTGQPKVEEPADATAFVPAEGDLSPGYQFAKRTLDIAVAAAALIVLAPVLLTVLAVLTVTTQGRPLYWQWRVGFQGRRFRMWKFRTMRLDADKLQHLVQNEATGPVFKNRRDPRITRIGRWLRKTSLDETPQLVSVLLGEMTLVGPRPLPVHEVAKMSPWQCRRHAVKPGLTCLWQVSGRSEIGFDDWAQMDVWYVEHQSLSNDLWLIAKTPWVVLTGKGAY